MPPRLGPWLAALSGTFLTSGWVGLAPRQVQSFRATRLARRAATPQWPETFVDETRDGSEGLYFSSESQLARHLFSDGGTCFMVFGWRFLRYLCRKYAKLNLKQGSSSIATR